MVQVQKVQLTLLFVNFALPRVDILGHNKMVSCRLYLVIRFEEVSSIAIVLRLSKIKTGPQKPSAPFFNQHVFWPGAIH